MTRKDYIIIADSIKYSIEYNNNAPETINPETLVSKLCDKLLKDNPRFDMRKFCCHIFGDR